MTTLIWLPKTLPAPNTAAAAILNPIDTPSCGINVNSSNLAIFLSVCAILAPSQATQTFTLNFFLNLQE